MWFSYLLSLKLRVLWRFYFDVCICRGYPADIALETTGCYYQKLNALTLRLSVNVYLGPCSTPCVYPLAIRCGPIPTYCHQYSATNPYLADTTHDWPENDSHQLSCLFYIFLIYSLPNCDWILLRTHYAHYLPVHFTILSRIRIHRYVPCLSCHPSTPQHNHALAFSKTIAKRGAQFDLRK